MERAERDDHVRGVPMGWEDDLSIPAPFSHAIPERRRARAATTTAALSVGENTFSNHPMSTGTTGISRTNYLQSSLAQAGSENSILQPRSSFPSGKHKHRSASPHKDLTALLDQSEINSANGMPNVVQSTPSLSSSTVRRKRSVFANLGALGIGSSLPLSPSRTKEAQAEILQSMSPVSPARTIKGEVRRTNTETEPAAERLPWELQDSAVFPLTSSPITSLPSSSPISPDAPFAHPVTDPAIVSSPSTDLSASIRSFAYDDSFARSLMVWGGPDYAGMRREWVIRKEKRGNFLSHSDRKGTEIGKMEKNSSINSTGEQKKDKEKDATWTGMSVGAEEVWENFLLGKFTVARDDVSPRSGGNLTSADATVNANSRGEGSQSLNTNLLGFRVPVGKPPQQRLIIKHLREEDKIQVVATSSSNRQIKHLNSTTPEDPSSSSAPDQELHSDPPVPNSDTVDSATSNLRSHRRDFQHPSILVHKHSRVAAFSISRQYRASSKEDKESASGRFHVVMLAPRDVQEAFTNTATTKKLGTVIDRHEAARAAFSPGHDQTIKEKDGKTKVKKQTSLYISSFRGKQRSSYRVGPVKSEGRIELDQRGVENRGFRQNASMPLALAKNSRTVQDTVGTQSAPAYGKSAEFTRSHDIGPERSVSEGQHIRVQAQNKLESRENHKRAYGTLDHPPHSFGTLSPIPPAPSRPAKILKRFLPWDLSLSSVSTSGHSSNSKVTSSTGSTATTAQSVSTGDTTPTHSTGSDISIPYDPPWVTFTSREQQEIQRNVLGQLEDSFEYVGLLPAKDRDKDSERSKNSNAIKRDRLHEIQVRGIMPKLHKKNDVLSFVPADAFFMLLPLWPAETDVYSQRSFPFQIPPTLVESRTYLLVFYKSLQMGESSKGSSIYDSQLKVLLPSFRAIARLISYQELQGTGIRIPEQGVSVNGPLESAFAQRPRLNDTVSEASIATTTPVSNSPSTAQLCVIASSYSRDAGLEFDPEALIELGLCRVLSSKENANALGNRPPAMEMGEKEDQLMTVKLTPIGSAVMEMVWVGGLALTSFGS
ncbi:hypothetical protein J3R30DRAFT_2402308 [Lentinula aciculospora]|uniref:Uncharacterized protein n=1 Tax=Lentinula aciculospora TaxID=153920 RepID=A0A9W9AG40_9AGAR|nr:hypothetical protein J3R30DRAFT_2402308 [Lentinula aciculospora]